MHDTPASLLSSDGETSGLGTIDQADPFHDSISVWRTGALSSASPTAMQCVGSEQDTPDRVFSVGEGEGLGTMDQAVPSHDSISVSWSVPTSTLPTAAQSVGPLHDTPERMFDVGEGERLGTIDQADPLHDSI